MDDELKRLLEKAKNHVMTEEEMKAQRESFIRAMKPPSDDDLPPEELARRQKNAENIDPQYRYPGPGPAPASWYINGAKVYRSFEDAVDD